jgi:quinol monooxygenase YgiN
MVIVMGEFRLPLHVLDEAREAMERVVTATRAEDGCQLYAYAEDVLDPGLFRVSEAWDSAQHLAAHLGMPHMAEWAQVRAGFGLTGRQITRYEIASAEAI